MRSTPVVFVVAFGAGIACGGGGGGPIDAGPDLDGRYDAVGPDARADGLGTVGNIPGSCFSGSLPRTMCRLLQVRCPDVAISQVEIRITDPPLGTPRRGTVVLGTGGGGGTYYETDPVARAMMLELSDAGFRLVQRQWIGADGWIAGPGGFPAVSCRYASLLQYIHDSIHQSSLTEALCVTGNSGGASEIAYAIARWARAPFIELAVPTGGPPMGRLDRGCLDGADPTWQSECATLVGTSSTCTPISCSYAPGAADLIDSAYAATHCATADDGFRSTFLADSVAAPTNSFDYGDTPVHFIFGADDCTEAVPLGLAYAEEITSAKTITFVPATGHPVFASAAGAAAIRDTLINECVVPPK
jgi:hypothetical protein